jgi:hypothetical protein
MGTLAFNIGQLDDQNGALPKAIQLAAAEILTAAEKAGEHVIAVSWFNPASTPEHHVPGFKGQGGVAVDFMVYGDKSVQDWIDAYVWANRVRLGVCWLISRRRIRSTSPGHDGLWHPYGGSDPHTTHSHVNFGHLAGTNGEHSVSMINYVPPKASSYQPAMVVGPNRVLVYNPTKKTAKWMDSGSVIDTIVKIIEGYAVTEAGYYYPYTFLVPKEK